MDIGIGRLVGKEPAIILSPLIVAYLLRLRPKVMAAVMTLKKNGAAA
jgi:hypothetical protein